MTAPTSPKPPTRPDLGLRTALTKLAEKWLSNKDRPSDYQDGVADAACAIRALLAAHPAPECACVTSGPDLDGPSETCPQHGRPYSEWVERGDILQARLEALNAPVSDTRREDVARALALVDSLVDPPMSGRYGRYADAVLAALPAPPVVDEAEVRERIAQDIEAEAKRRWTAGWTDWTERESGLDDGLTEAARIARGATR